MSKQINDLDTILSVNREQFPHACYVIERLVVLAPMFRSSVTDMLNNYGTNFFERAEARIGEIEYLSGYDHSCFDKAIQAYVKFCLEFVRKQAEFLRTGKYSVVDYEDVYNTLYNNDDSMQNYYLIALLFSFIFSPNYYEFYDFFESEFLTNIPTTGTVAEIGCGHGVYLTQTLLANQGLHGLGIDISNGALKVTRKMFSYYDIDKNRYKLTQGDLRSKLHYDDGFANTIICCEVLEHLPDPSGALCELSRLIADDGFLMISVAIRMESVDHLYVFNSCHEFTEMLGNAGLRSKSERVIPLAKGDICDPAKRQQLIEDPRVPIGYICTAYPD